MADHPAETYLGLTHRGSRAARRASVSPGKQAERMSGRIEHDDDAVLLRLVVCDLRASRYGVVEQLEEAGASIRSITQVVHGDVQVHAHLLLAGDSRPNGRYERLLALKLKLLVPGGRLDQCPPTGDLLGAIHDSPSQQPRVELRELPSIDAAQNGTA